MKATQEPASPLLLRTAEMLVKLQQELDELALQFALGKAEARDVFETVKHDLSDRLHTFQQTQLGAFTRDVADSIRAKTDELMVQLSLGIANTKDEFDAQLLHIEKRLHEVELEIKTKLPDALNRIELEHEFEKFKLKLAILKLKFKLGKFELRDQYKDTMQDMKEHVHDLATNIRQFFNREKDLADRVKTYYKRLRKSIDSIA